MIPHVTIHDCSITQLLPYEQPVEFYNRKLLPIDKVRQSQKEQKEEYPNDAVRIIDSEKTEQGFPMY